MNTHGTDVLSGNPGHTEGTLVSSEGGPLAVKGSGVPYEAPTYSLVSSPTTRGRKPSVRRCPSSLDSSTTPENCCGPCAGHEDGGWL